jgi:hypothetical protein
LVAFPPRRYRPAVRSAYVCAVVCKPGRTVCQRLERPRALVDQTLVSRERVRGRGTRGFQSLRVDASAVGGFCCGDVSTRLCCGRDAAGFHADQELFRLFYALRSFAWTLDVAYWYGKSQYWEVPLRLVDLVVPSDQKLGIGPTRDGHRSGPTSGEIDYQVQLVV